MKSFRYLWKLCMQIVQKKKIKAKIHACNKAVYWGLFKGFSYVTACSHVFIQPRNKNRGTEANSNLDIIFKGRRDYRSRT